MTQNDCHACARCIQALEQLHSEMMCIGDMKLMYKMKYDVCIGKGGGGARESERERECVCVCARARVCVRVCE